MKTLPPALEIRTSGIEGTGLGVFAREDIPSRTIFSAYEGVVVMDPHNERDNSYACKILDKNSEALFLIDGKDRSRSNWLRYVNTARFADDLNVKTAQCRDQMYYYTVKPVPAGHELLVGYKHGHNNAFWFQRQPFCWNHLLDETCWPFFYSKPKESCVNSLCGVSDKSNETARHS
ncbi:histone-lysine N-methyltransferase set-17-like [Gigantopelta aegis]|uniref:histone-lysine N-methyltransferase set-17-like n=1 Tax=Gigantopelta aegis TaxID=1735272 RepID=UPI001B88D963|nr:histone-lysine N-methyltransferase set-17-like [Gigantopelta aegis]